MPSMAYGSDALKALFDACGPERESNDFPNVDPVLDVVVPEHDLIYPS